MYEIFQILKQAGMVIYFLNLMMVTELLLRNRKERWSIVGHVPFNPVRVSAGIELYLSLSLGWSKINKFSIATGIMSTAIFFLNRQHVFLIRSRCRIDSNSF